MFKERSKALFVATLLATAYVIYLMCYFGGIMTSSDSAEALGGVIASALVTPHMIVIAIGAILGWVGFFGKKAWGALVGAILYSVGALLFLLYVLFCIPLIILGFVGYSKQKKLLKNK